MVDLRKDKRAPASLKVKYKSVTVDQFIEQFGTDVSRGGIFVKTKKPIEIGALLKLELQLNDASPVIHGIGRVCWRREPGPDPNLSAGMGIKFIKLDPESRTIVERIVQQRGDRPSRFEQTQGAEIAPPSISPPPASGAPPPITVPPPSAPVKAAAPIATQAKAPTFAAPAAPKVPARAAAPATAAPVPTAPAKVSPAVRAPAAPMPAAPAPAPAKPATAGSRAVAGLFADSPLSRSNAGEAGAELRTRSSFFPPAPGNNGSGSLSRPNSSRPTSGRSEQARQSGQFLATAFAEGGLAEDTTAQARAAADAGTDELLDELFDEVVKTSEHPAPPPVASAASGTAPALRGGASIAGAARVSQPSPMRESVDDMFAELSQEEGLPPSSPALQARRPASSSSSAPRAFPSAPAARTFPSAPVTPEFDEERTTVRSSVDELLDGLDDELATDSVQDEQAATDDDGFGEADIFAADRQHGAASSPSDPPVPRILSSAPAAPPEIANAMQRRSSALPFIIVLLLVAAAGGGFYFYKQQQAAQQQPAAAPAAPVAADPAAANAAPPEQPAADPAAAAPTDPGAKPAADPGAAPGAAPTPAPARAEAPAAAARNIEVEVSSDPRGAEITVDGKPVGNAPARVTLVVDKPSEVKVSAPGFAPAVRSLVPSLNNEPLRFKLEALPYTLIVRSTPPGASLAVGDHVALAPAPLELGHLDGGVQVSISKDGYQRMTRLVRLDEFSMQGAAMRAEIDVTLSPLPGGGEVARPRPRPRPRMSADAPPAPAPAPEAETSAPAAPSERAPAAEPAPAAAKPPAEPAPAPPTPPGE